MTKKKKFFTGNRKEANYFKKNGVGDFKKELRNLINLKIYIMNLLRLDLNLLLWLLDVHYYWL